MKFKEQKDVREIWNNFAHAIIVPPNPKDKTGSWNAQVYSMNKPDLVYFGTRCLSGKIIDSCTEKIKGEKTIMGFLVQITNADQYVYFRSKKGSPLVFTAFAAETSAIQDLTEDKKILLGEKATDISLAIPVYLTTITFSTHAIKDQEVIDRVVDTIWKA